MNKKTVFTIIAVLALIGSIVLGVFTDIGNDLPAIGLSALSLSVLIILTYKKSEKKDGITIASIVCMVIAGFAAGFAEMSEDTFAKLTAAVGAVVALIVSILIPVISNALSKKKTE